MPDDDECLARVRRGLELVAPFQTAMSLEDEMTVLELIEEHEDFPKFIAVQARNRTDFLHAAATRGPEEKPSLRATT